MRVGHINLARSFNGAGEHFVRLVEMLAIHGLDQHVVVRNPNLAQRLTIIDGVTVGSRARSPVTAFCQMPAVDVVHLHDQSSWQAGLLFMFTRSVPYVLTAANTNQIRNGAISNAARRRAAGWIDPDIADVITHIQVYRQATDSLNMPTLLL